MTDPIFRTKLPEDVAERMIERIRSQEWGVGMKLPSEPDLAAFFDVSRATVRVAVKSLGRMGVLRSKSGSGTYVTEAAPLILEKKELALASDSKETLYSLIQARFYIEPILASLAAEKATMEECSALFSLVEEMEAHPDRHSLMVHGSRFHQQIAAAAHNQVLSDFCRSIAAQLRGLRALEHLTEEMFIDGIEEHRAIALAIEDGNPSLAAELMRAHLKKDYGIYLDRVE